MVDNSNHSISNPTTPVIHQGYVEGGEEIHWDGKMTADTAHQMLKNVFEYTATENDLGAVEEAIKTVWNPKLSFIFKDKKAIEDTVVISYDSRFIYLWTTKKTPNLYKIPHQLPISAELQYAWRTGIAPKIKTLLPDAMKNSSRFSIPLISGGLLAPFTTLQKSFHRKNNPYTTYESYLATIVHELGHVYWNQYKLWWYANKKENLEWLKTAKRFYTKNMEKGKPSKKIPIRLPEIEGLSELFATCAEYQASMFFWPNHQKNFDIFASNRIEQLLKSEETKNLEQEDSVLEPRKFPHHFAIVFGKIILNHHPNTWPRLLTSPRLLIT